MHVSTSRKSKTYFPLQAKLPSHTNTHTSNETVKLLPHSCNEASMLETYNRILAIHWWTGCQSTFVTKLIQAMRRIKERKTFPKQNYSHQDPDSKISWGERKRERESGRERKREREWERDENPPKSSTIMYPRHQVAFFCDSHTKTCAQ